MKRHHWVSLCVLLALYWHTHTKANWNVMFCVYLTKWPFFKTKQIFMIHRYMDIVIPLFLSGLDEGAWRLQSMIKKRKEWNENICFLNTANDYWMINKRQCGYCHKTNRLLNKCYYNTNNTFNLEIFSFWM